MFVWCQNLSDNLKHAWEKNLKLPVNSCFSWYCIFFSTLRCSEAQELIGLQRLLPKYESRCSISPSVCSTCSVKVVSKCCAWLKTLHWVLLFWRGKDKRWKNGTMCLSVFCVCVWVSESKTRKEKRWLQSKQELAERVNRMSEQVCDVWQTSGKNTGNRRVSDWQEYLDTTANGPGRGQETEKKNSLKRDWLLNCSYLISCCL